MKQVKFAQWFQALSLGVALMGVMACAETAEVRTPAKELYYQGLASYEDEIYSETDDKLKKVIAQSPGTRLATLSYLKLADLYYQQSKWDDSETNYRLFLTLTPDSHLTPYVLHRLIVLNYQRNIKALTWFQSPDDMGPNRKIVQEYQRFFFLYPNNAYLPDVKDALLGARAALAQHEFEVGNFYFRQKAYDSAILRYLHLLQEYPEFPQTRHVGLQLIRAYEANQQPFLAQEMRDVLRVRFSDKVAAQH